MSVCVCARACMHFIYLCTLPSGMLGPHLGGWDSAASPLSLPGQMAPVTERGGGAMEGKVEGGELSTVPEWPVPRATTSGDHLQLAHPAPSVLIPFPLAHAHFLILFFLDGGGGSGAFGQTCARISLTLVCHCYGQIGRSRRE